MTRTVEEVAALTASDRVPTPSGLIEFSEPMSIMELMLRLHRPGLGDRRLPIRVSLRVEAATERGFDPESRAAVETDMRIEAHGDLTEHGDDKHVVVATVHADADMRITMVQILSSAPFISAQRVTALLTTPLRDRA